MIVNFNEKKLETDFEKLGSKQSYQYFYKNQFLETEDKNHFFRNYDTSKQTHSPMDSTLQGHSVSPNGCVSSPSSGPAKHTEYCRREQRVETILHTSAVFCWYVQRPLCTAFPRACCHVCMAMLCGVLQVYVATVLELHRAGQGRAGQQRRAL
jgi:hypothetical protein